MITDLSCAGINARHRVVAVRPTNESGQGPGGRRLAPALGRHVGGISVTVGVAIVVGAAQGIALIQKTVAVFVLGQREAILSVCPGTAVRTAASVADRRIVAVVALSSGVIALVGANAT